MKILLSTLLVLMAPLTFAEETLSFLPDNQIRNNDLNIGWMCPYVNNKGNREHVIVPPRDVLKVTDVADLRSSLDMLECVPAFRYETTEHFSYVYSFEIGAERTFAENADKVTSLPVYQSSVINKSKTLANCSVNGVDKYILFAGGSLSASNFLICKPFNQSF